MNTHKQPVNKSITVSSWWQLLALVVMGASLPLPVLADQSNLIYENDFSTRTSESALSSVWAEYEYDKGGPLAYDFDYATMSDRYTGMYPWQGTASGTVPYS